MRASLCRTHLCMAPLLLLVQAAFVPLVLTEHEIPAASPVSRGSGPLAGVGERRLSGTPTLQQRLLFRVRASGVVEVVLTLIFQQLTKNSLTSVHAPIMSDTDMHCLEGDVAVSDLAGNELVSSRNISGRTVLESFSVPADLDSDTYTVILNYAIGSGICETTDGGPKRFYFPWAQRWSGVDVNTTSYFLEFPDEPLDVTNFVCLGAANLDSKCGSKQLGADNGVIHDSDTKFLLDAFFEWEMPRTPSQGRVCPYSMSTGSGVVRNCKAQAVSPITNMQTAVASPQGPGRAKEVLFFICVAGSILAVSITLGHVFSFQKARTSQGGNPVGGNPTPTEDSNGNPMKTPRELLHPAVYVLYGLLLFFAYWFGAHRFDYDDDGDFDTYDVAAYLQDRGIIRRQFKKDKKTSKRYQLWSVWRTVKHAITVPDDGHDGSDSPQDSKGSPEDGISLEDVEIATATPAIPTPMRPKRMDGTRDDLPDMRSQERIVADRLSTGQTRPIFIIGQCVIVSLLWIIFAIKTTADGEYSFFNAKAGLMPVETFELVLTHIHDCDDLRPEIWRWFSYQFIHVGFMHLFGNCVLNLILGIPLEGAHGTLRMILMFNIGVFGGACASLLSTPHTPTVGMSGGCYAMFGIHLADLMINWHSKRYRFPTLSFLVVLALGDILNYAVTDSSSTSHSTHFGGYCSGMLIGLLLCKRFGVGRAEKWEFMLALGTVAAGAMLLVGTLGWTLHFWPPRDMWDSTAWCWGRAVSSYRIFGTSEYQCVRCATQECIDSWMAEPRLVDINVEWCSERGWFSSDAH